MLLCAGSAFLAMLSFAATPENGTVSEATASQSYTAGPFLVANQSPLGLGQLDQGPRCDSTTFPCDSYKLTVSLPAGYVAAHPNASLKVALSWTDTGAGQSDYDLYIYKGDVPTLNGSKQADYQSAGGSNPEVASVSPLVDGDQVYTIKIVPFQPTGETVNVKIDLLSGDGGATGPTSFGGADPTTPGNPRYLNFYAPSGSTAEPSNGEFNIGFNPNTGRIMTMNSGPIWRITPPELLKKPECCEGLWQDVSNPSTLVGLDPILWTDQPTGRTFASNSTVGTNGIYGFSDDDGDTWLPVSAAPPNAASDHETIGSGPYPAALAALANPVNQGRAVYYCAQTYPVGAAACQRSDTLGSSYGPSTLPYDGNTTQCRGIHGHVRVGPDGTVFLPVRDCNGNAGLVVSLDGGTTWHESVVPNSKVQTHGSDPTVAIGAQGTIYFFYVADLPLPEGSQAPKEGHAHVQVGKLNSDTGEVAWSKDSDLGVSHGIRNAVFPEAIAGDDGRAAVGFLGTDKPGDYEGASFPGIWYPFIATTYDGGNSWTVVNATPNDPVQGAGGIWQGGGSNQNRNLLDFNEITIDDKGRVLFGYSDGCVTERCISGQGPTDYVAFMRVAHQSGGRTLFAANDANTDTTTALPPKAPCLSGTRDQTGSHLSWKAPDNGGSDITTYYIFRATVSGGEGLVPIAQTTGPKTQYFDATADPAVKDYFYFVKAINMNGSGIGASSNEIDLQVVAAPPVENVCSLKGLTILTDAAADSTGPSGTDLLSAHMSQPYVADGNVKFIFTINTDQNTTGTPPGSGWYIAIKVADPNDSTKVRYTGVRMDGAASGPTFSSYVPGTNTSGGTDGRFVDSSKPAEPQSNYDPNKGVITIVVKASDLGLNPGDTITGFVSGSSQSTDPLNLGAGATQVWDSMPDSLTFTGGYVVKANAACAPNTAPTAVLKADRTSGPSPLTVNFDGSASSDPDIGDTIVSYTFDFGDGSPQVTQSSPTTAHTYKAAGAYAAQLTVSDSRNLVSLNASRVLIQLNAALQNISTRGVVQTGENVLIGGFIVTGDAPRNLLLRAIGPSQTVNNKPVGGALQDPTLELHDGSGAVIAFNDNWKTSETGGSQQTLIENTGAAPKDDRESAMVKQLAPGNYTAIVRGKGDTTGIALVEAYDIDPAGGSKLANISTRGSVQTGDNVLIGGFIAGPGDAAPTRVLLRGIGPSLSQQGVQQPLQDPTLELHDANGTKIDANNDWKESRQSDIAATGIPPSDDRESAILVDALPPGPYTAILAGANNGVGVGLVEIYNLP